MREGGTEEGVREAGGRLDAKFSLVLFVRSFVRCVVDQSVTQAAVAAAAAAATVETRLFLSPMTRVFFRCRYALRRARYSLSPAPLSVHTAARHTLRHACKKEHREV